MHYSTVTQKGQITIPKEIRDALHIHAGSKVAFTITDTNASREITISICHKTELEELCGFLPKPKKALSIEEMNDIIERKNDRS